MQQSVLAGEHLRKVCRALQRGAAIIKARGVFLLNRPQTQVVDTVCFLTDGAPRDNWHSVAGCSDGDCDVDEGLISSSPVRVCGGKWEIVPGLPVNDFSRSKIDASGAELKEEKSLVGDLIGN